MITRQQKEELVASISKKIADSKAMVFVDYRGLTVEDMTEIRRELRAKNVELKVMKHSLFEIAAKQVGAEVEMGTLANHPVAIAFGQDEVEPAKVIYEFSKKHENLEMIGGAISGKSIEMSELKALAMMPSREEMYARIVGSLASPLRGIASVLQGNLRGLVSVLSQISENR